MPKLTVAQISDLRALRDHCVALGADLVVIGAIRFDSGVNAFVFGLWKNWVYWVCIGCVLGGQRSRHLLSAMPELSLKIFEYAHEHGRVTIGDIVKLTGVGTHSNSTSAGIWKKAT
jgi:hypothetical protein